MMFLLYAILAISIGIFVELNEIKKILKAKK